MPSSATQFECSYEALTGGPATVGWDREYIYVQDRRTDDGRRALKPLTIRDGCDCARCREPSSGQKTFSSTELPLDLGIANVRPTEEGLALTWTTDIERIAAAAAEQDGAPHETLLPWAAVELALRRTSMEDAVLPRKRSLLQRTGAVYWDRDTLGQHVRRIDYGEYMREGSAAFWAAVADLLRLGIVFLENVPRDEASILRVVGRIANVRETFYGRTFDVRAKPDAENVAYTSGALAPHQDLAYLEPQPMIQALHYMENSCAGGESTFVDGERVGRLLFPFTRASRAMAPLADLHIPYHYAKRGFSYFASRRVIDVNEGGYAGIFWSPPFQGRLLCPTRDLRPWIPPARVFEAMLGDDRALFRSKMREGDCVLFDNQRVLHGRAAFHPAAGGSRWLRGAYIAAEDFLSTAAHIPPGHAEALRGPQPWSPALAQRRLRQSWWHADALRRVMEVDPDFKPSSLGDYEANESTATQASRGRAAGSSFDPIRAEAMKIF
ncbi:Gamma-butyrobetaine dioxygenase [Escovopsis weberi]|uniref:Gamma-butyrobetaine dioxygenase n=1 Tax=Escovopsis weberi TaxID=150374 RepID=A0A0M8MUL7_ESCWE|nr:Gamma-butyrobetaine dioxygenase [Escovopsis weberi]